MKIKLPGNTKVKAIILVILIAVSLGILLKERKYNKEMIKSQQAVEERIINEDEENKIFPKEESNVEKLDKEYNKAYETFFKKNYDETIKIADNIINENADYYKAYNIRGIAKVYDGKYDEGMKDIDKSLEIKNDYGYGRFNKALSYELKGKYDEALNWYNKALEVDEYVWTYYGIASIYGRKGDVDNTIKYLKKAIELDPEVKNVAKEEEDFDPVKNNSKFKELVS